MCIACASLGCKIKQNVWTLWIVLGKFHAFKRKREFP